MLIMVLFQRLPRHQHYFAQILLIYLALISNKRVVHTRFCFCGPRDDLSFNTAGGFLCFYSIVIKIFTVHLFVCTVNCLDQAKASIACYHIFN